MDNDTDPQPPLASGTSRGISVLYSVTIFLGAFLLFLIEPLFAKIILPWFGGSAAVWAVCLVFFQSALLLGYAYADFVSRRLSERRQMMLHIALLLVSLLLLPIAPGARWRPSPSDDPAWRILGLLTASIGLPFVLLSSTSPLVQTWHARRRPGSDPYHLFALSNLASFLALLSYPFLIEPRTASHAQLLGWSVAYGAFVCVCAYAALAGRGAGLPERVSADGSAVTTGWRDKFLWLSLSACGSMLLLSVTNHLTQNVAPVPLLWVLPLALYLLTFALVFQRRSVYHRWLMVWLLAVALASLGYGLYKPGFTRSIQVSVPLFCAGLFICCLFCNGELYRRKPAARELTSYYLTISFGGALGAVFVGLVAPQIFRNLYELPLTLLLTAVLALAVMWPAGRLPRLFWAAAAAALCGVLALNVRSRHADAIVMVRNFYGALRVTQTMDAHRPIRTLYNGTIDHGEQFLAPELSRKATSYYSEESGIGLAMENCCAGPKRAGIIGLGTGTLAVYGKPGDVFRFYDINPQVVEIARTYFTYLRDSPAKTEIVPGDARLSLEREATQQFDVLAVDAFSGDAIPVHLLTLEAMRLYLRHLKPDGVLAIHTSNRYLELAPVVKQLADAVGCAAVTIRNEDDDDNLVSSSDWVLVTRNRKFLELPEIAGATEEIKVPPGLRPWTDDYNNLFQILRRIGWKESRVK